eukprot:112417-Alexandrium_andersonii.AAC.1
MRVPHAPYVCRTCSLDIAHIVATSLFLSCARPGRRHSSCSHSVVAMAGAAAGQKWLTGHRRSEQKVPHS